MATSKYLILPIVATILACIVPVSLYAQALQGKALADSFIHELSGTNSDTSRVKLILKAAEALESIEPPAAMHYADSAMNLSQQYQWAKGIAIAYLDKARIYDVTSEYATSIENAGKAYDIFKSINRKPAMGDALAIISNNYERLGNYTKAIENNFKALSIYEEAGLRTNIAWTYNNIGADYYQVNDFEKALENYNKALELQKKLNDLNGIASALDNIASVYEDEGEFDKVNEYNLQAIKLFEEINDQPALGRIYINRGNFLQRQKNFDSALIFYKKAINIATVLDIKRTLAFGNGGIGELYFNVAKNGPAQYIIPASLKISNPLLLEKAYGYFNTALQLSKKEGELSLMMQFTQSLSATETLRGNYKKALALYKESTRYKDSMFNDDNKTKIATLENERLAEVKDKEIQLLNKEKALQNAQQEKKDAEERRVKNIQYFTIAALGIVVLAVVIIALLQYRNNKQRQKANILLQQQKEKVESTLVELKATQAQLIQSEKMASLGELTAGIAHEIQNPLNFVNNFSEVNSELIQEFRSERLKEDRNENIENEILNDITQNLEKIIFHGRRADGIVKGMMQHSSVSTGKKELTDINTLADEYLRLTYHGLRAKDSTFNVALKTDFDESIEKLNIVSQDLGRVFLNLFNNAFYSVNEKRKKNSDAYEPAVSISTRRTPGGVEIRVTDNGSGIPQKILDKIFQPFFTTKPTGQGTGLGLSLSYDIITKEHGGTLRAETEEGEFATFIIELPRNLM